MKDVIFEVKMETIEGDDHVVIDQDLTPSLDIDTELYADMVDHEHYKETHRHFKKKQDAKMRRQMMR